MADRQDDLRQELAEQLKFYAGLGVTHLKIEEPVLSPGESKVTEEVTSTLDTVRQDLGECTRCQLHATRKNIVFGTGSPKADLMFVGEAPGADEDEQGLPFVGAAGQLLTKIIAAIGLTRKQVYIANILKCRPPNNRDPKPQEVEACEPVLFKQIEVIEPMIIVALGKYAAQTLLRSDTPISRLRGQFFEYRGSRLMPTFHPSYLLRNPSAKREVWEDMKLVRSTLEELGSAYYR
ncbi:MAG: uracil-DNA glycosylase [Acidobacteriota bacterium]|nr:MAG: uracil-DNA glycosylase [Acidobacteriota bacterium]